MLYSIVVPVYNSEHTLEDLYRRLVHVFDEELKRPFELLLVDDSSRDGSFAVMEKLRAADRRVKIFQMARNFGQHPALLCGFHYVEGDFVITMDDDLQHPPEEIPKLIHYMDEHDEVDVILARYQNRQHSLFRRAGTFVSMHFTTKMLGKNPDLEITSFRLMRRFIVDSIRETTIHLPQIGNLLLMTSNRIVNVDVRHDARAYGRSGYTVKELVHELLYDITTNSAFPLIVVRNLGIVTFVISIILAIVFFIQYLMGVIKVPGWTSIILVLLASTGLTLLSIGILGDYMLHVLDESRKVPHYVLRKKDI
ncbi:MAG: glycosyltransferase family 2 protein [Lachnospiraceae bacterium]|nr:glycosyltransferase family 2 protein [Lachnospiraceae bacterium]